MEPVVGGDRFCRLAFPATAAGVASFREQITAALKYAWREISMATPAVAARCRHRRHTSGLNYSVEEKSSSFVSVARFGARRVKLRSGSGKRKLPFSFFFQHGFLIEGAASSCVRGDSFPRQQDSKDAGPPPEGWRRVC